MRTYPTLRWFRRQNMNNIIIFSIDNYYTFGKIPIFSTRKLLILIDKDCITHEVVTK